MEILRIEQSDDSPLVILDHVDRQFEISGKSLPEHVLDFYQPVLDWLNEYKEKPDGKTVFNIKLVYFNTTSSKMIMDILHVFVPLVRVPSDQHIISLCHHLLNQLSALFALRSCLMKHRQSV